MFNFNKEYLNQGIGTGGGYIKESGCYEMAITEAYLLKIQDKISEALVLEFEDIEEKKAKINIWYKDKNGDSVEFQEKHISHLIYLLGVNPELAQRTSINSEKKREEIPAFKDKMIGVILEFKGTEKYNGNDGKEYSRYNYNLKGFYDVSTKQTADEKNENKEVKSYYYWLERFLKENKEPVKKEVAQNNTKMSDEDDLDDEDFPF